MIHRAIVTIFVLLSSVFSQMALAANVGQIKADHVRIRLIAPQVFSQNEENLVGVRFELDEHWHVYWKNPGDSGAAPKFDISVANAEVGTILWPAPKRLPIAHLTNFGYENAVTYLFSVRPKADLLDLKLKLEWLVCQEECIPGFGDLELKRPARNGSAQWNSLDEKIVRESAARIPSNSNGAPLKIESVQVDGDSLLVRTSSNAKELDLFPTEPEFVTPAAPVRLENGEFKFKISQTAKAPASLGFVATSRDGAWEFLSIPISRAGQNLSSVGGFTPFLLLILSAILGGFLLNLMPCVFPVISIKAFSLLKTQGRDRIRDCLLYSLGVMVTFTSLGVLFLVLRGLGSAVGWGFQLQSPLVIFALILLFFAMALNFLGVFEFGTKIMNVAGKKSTQASSFGTGVLSVFVAAPCTGPFMGTALGAAATLPSYAALALFFSLGLGLALPFLFFALSPRTLSWLPRPGAWMETLKQFFAFPLLATVIWLIWVLGQQTGTSGWFFASSALLCLAFSFWLARLGGRVRTVLAWVIAISAILAAGSRLHTIQDIEMRTEKSAWTKYSETELANARAAHRPVFVDFTAAWCITCQVNKQAVLETQRAEDAFKRQNVLLMSADWTRYDPVITAALSRLGRNSVPVYAYYPPDGSAPRLLPQILTYSMIENLDSNLDR